MKPRAAADGRNIILRRAALSVAAVGLGALATAALSACSTVPAATPPTPHLAAAVKPAMTFTCSVPTPTSAAGYSAMFRNLPTPQWGAADVAISTRVGVANVWLFGDTISGTPTQWTRMVHSTVVTQRYGCLHVSHGGAQTLPNEADGSWYWIKAAAPVDSTHLRITADRVQRTGPGAWDFKVVGERTATAVLDGDGDVTFQSWTGARVAPQNVVQKDGPYPPWSSTVSEVATGRVLVTGLPHSTSHWSYAPSVHPETRMASGKTLLTVCQNGSPLTYSIYRPLFYEVAL